MSADYVRLSWVKPADENSLADARRYGRHFTHLSPMAFQITADAAIRSIGAANRPEWQAGCLLPQISNRGLGAEDSRRLLADGLARRRLAEAVAHLCRTGNYQGCNLDLLGPLPDQRGNLAALIEEIAWQLHSEERLLSVNVPARHREAELSQADNAIPAHFQPQAWCDLYDYHALGIYADHFVLMAVELPGGFRSDDRPDGSGLLPAPRALASRGWIGACLDYALECVPPRHLVLGLPLYGQRWIKNGKRWRVGPFAAAGGNGAPPEAAAWAGPVPVWDEDTGSYRVETEQGIVYYDDAASLSKKAAPVFEQHLGGLALWRLGFGGEEMARISSLMAERQD